jgi:hypothetical protein
MEITQEIAQKVLDTVNVGLVRGKGKPVPGKMCVEAAVCYAMGLPHSDRPPCVSPALRDFKIKLNDSKWSSELARANGLRELALLQLGTAGVLDEVEFAKRVVLLVINKYLPPMLRKVNLNREADDCEQAKDLDTAGAAADAASVAAYVAAHTPAVCNAATRAARAAVYATWAAVIDDDTSATYAFASLPSGNKTLLSFAKDLAAILIDMKVPGVQWLHLLTEQKGE